MPDDVELCSGIMRLRLRPGWGGRVSSLVHERFGDILVPIAASAFDPENWPRAGAYPLVPFHNRVRNARFAFGGREARLRAHSDALPHALHGMGSRGAWSVLSAGERDAEIGWQWDASSEWPWRFEARQRFVLDADMLALTMTLRNSDDAPMPAGLGWHPYFPAAMRCRTDARIHWPIGGDYLPLGGSEARGGIGATAYLSDWRETLLEGDGFAVSLRAEGMEHLVIHAPPGGSVVCVEPVTHLAGAPNEPERAPGPAEGGMTTLQPGDALICRIEVAVRGTR